MRVASTYIVTQTGVGKPDYSRIVTAARERRGVYLGYGQTLKIFSLVFSAVASPFTWVTGVLAPAAIAHLIDTDTGLAMPYTVPQGYTLTLIAAAAAVTEDILGWAYLDTFRILPLGMGAGGETYYENKLVGVSTALVDPTGATAHTMDITLTNLGLGDLEGSVDYVCILEDVGSEPLPLVKTVKCKWCGHEQEVPNEKVYITCSECGQLFIVYDLSKFKETV